MSVILLTGNWHTGFQACIRTCALFHTSNYVKIWRVDIVFQYQTARTERVFFTDPLLGDYYLEGHRKRVGQAI